MSAMPTWIHSQLQQDCLWIMATDCAELLLMNNAHYPWLLVVPRGENLRELQDLTEADFMKVCQDARKAGLVLQKLFQPKKINTAALGNMVPQLHIHVIARFESDPAWPKPVWGVGQAKAYEDPVAVIDKIRAAWW